MRPIPRSSKHAAGDSIVAVAVPHQRRRMWSLRSLSYTTARARCARTLGVCATALSCHSTGWSSTSAELLPATSYELIRQSSVGCGLPCLDGQVRVDPGTNVVWCQSRWYDGMAANSEGVYSLKTIWSGGSAPLQVTMLLLDSLCY